MKKISFLILSFLLFGLNGSAQSTSNTTKKTKESFEEFRNRIKGNYDSFRNTILEHYADFLNGEWHEYESLNGLKRDETPKPEEAPRVAELPSVPTQKPVKTKPVKPEPIKPEPKSEPVKSEPVKAEPAKPEPKSEPVKAEPAKPEPKSEPIKAVPAKPEPKSEPVKPEPVKPEPKSEPVKAEPAKPEPIKPEPAKPEPAKPEPLKPEPAKPEPVKPSKPSLAQNNPLPASPTPTGQSAPLNPSSPSKPSKTNRNFDFTFYEIPMELADVDFNISNSLSSPSDFSTQWKNLEAQKVADKLLPSIKKEIKNIGLNDYLTYRYLESYVNSKFPNVAHSSRMALVHYLLVNMGYDARIAVTTKGTPLLLIPFKQTVYGNTYLSLNNKKYYIFPPEGYDVKTIFAEKVMTCQLPTGVDTGNTFDLVLGELNIPIKPKAFDLEYGPIHLTGEMNENLIPILYKYPQMPIEDYAKSNLQPNLRKDLTNQLKSQIGNMEGDQGVEALLHFTQNAFQYATDDNYHGFEKPYFVEETLFYPKNDCEDRAIFYTYFLYNALNRDAQLVSFPGHEAATVELKNPSGGVSYNQNGKTFYISDPTYIGASSGMVMPSFMNVKPDIDYTYSK